MPASSSAPKIEIFRPGTFTAMSGQTVSFGGSDLAAIAAVYDPSISQAPLVVGHPKHDSPAYGWVKGLAIEGGRLIAIPDQVDAAFADSVSAGRLKYVSASFYSPKSPNNPRPGTYYLRHVGFLGAMPPAVKGLKPVSFSESDDGIISFGDIDGSLIIRMLRGMREWMIDKFGTDAADVALPGSLIDAAQEQAAQPDADDGADPCCSDPPQTMDVMMPTTNTAAREADLAARERDLRIREDAMIAETRKRQDADNLAFCDKMISDGRMRPTDKTKAIALMGVLADHGQMLNFSDGGGTISATPLDIYRQQLLDAPRIVDFSEVAAGAGAPGGSLDFACPSGATIDQGRLNVHARAIDWQRQHPGADYLSAIKAVGGV